jgi:hypothetical protein
MPRAVLRSPSASIPANKPSESATLCYRERFREVGRKCTTRRVVVVDLYPHLYCSWTFRPTTRTYAHGPEPGLYSGQALLYGLLGLTGWMGLFDRLHPKLTSSGFNSPTPQAMWLCMYNLATVRLRQSTRGSHVFATTSFE